MSIRFVAGALALACLTGQAAAQDGPSLSGTYCGTWASGNSWQMTLQQTGTSVAATVSGKRPDGSASSGSGRGTSAGARVTVSLAFSRGATGTFTGQVSGATMSASFSRTEPNGPRGRDTARFTRC